MAFSSSLGYTEATTIQLTPAVLVPAATSEPITAKLSLPNGSGYELSTGLYGSSASMFINDVWSVTGIEADVEAALADVYLLSPSTVETFDIEVDVRNASGVVVEDGAYTMTGTELGSPIVPDGGNVTVIAIGGGSTHPFIDIDVKGTIDTAGTGYAVDDVLTVVGGTFESALEALVTSVNGSGGVTGVTTNNVSSYTVAPPEPAVVTGGGGTGALLDLDQTFDIPDMDFSTASATVRATLTMSPVVGSFLTGKFGNAVSTFSGGVLSIYGLLAEVKAALQNIKWLRPDSYANEMFDVTMCIFGNSQQNCTVFSIVGSFAGDTIGIVGQDIDFGRIIEGDNAVIGVVGQITTLSNDADFNGGTIALVGQISTFYADMTLITLPDTIGIVGQDEVFGSGVIEDPDTIGIVGQSIALYDDVTFSSSPDIIGIVGQNADLGVNEGQAADTIGLVGQAQTLYDDIKLDTDPDTIGLVGQIAALYDDVRFITIPNNISMVGQNDLLITKQWIMGGDAIAYSYDASTWTEEADPLPTNTRFRTVNFNVVSGIWVSAGDDGNLYTATDPTLIWTSRTSGFGASTINKVANDGTTWVIVGTSGKLFTATDPTGTWTSRTSGFGASTINSIAHDGSGTWVTVGGLGKLFTATDPTGTWTSRTSGFGTTPINDVAYDGTTWVTVGSFGKLFTATDPTGTWIDRTISGNPSFQCVAYDGTTWVAAGGNGIIYTATDPTGTWTLRTTPFTTEIIVDIAYTGDTWVGVAAGSGKIITATNPTGTWTESTPRSGDGFWGIGSTRELP